MLKSTFLHIPSVGRSTEAYLWSKGALTWERYLELEGTIRLSPQKAETIRTYLLQSLQAHKEENHSYFSARLAQKEHWRAYPDFRKVCFLDIETTGLSPYFSDITVIGVHHAAGSDFFIKGKNMGEFDEFIKPFSTIVTFNGKAFDLPFIQAKNPSISFDQLHIDLRYTLARLGYRGGLKAIEPQLGIIRSDEVQGIDGFEAVRLWRKYERGDKGALDTLIAYNKEDIENLRPIADFAYSHLRDKELKESKAAVDDSDQA